jgi:hypothetical protein
MSKNIPHRSLPLEKSNTSAKRCPPGYIRKVSVAVLQVELFLIYLFSGTRRRKVSGTIRNERATRMITTVMVTIHPCTEGEQGHYPPLCGGGAGTLTFE